HATGDRLARRVRRGGGGQGRAAGGRPSGGLEPLGARRRRGRRGRRQRAALRGPRGMTAPLLLVGHGTVDAVGVAEFGAFTRRLGRRLSDVGVDVDGGFIELSSPTVHEAWAALAARGHRTMAAVPLVLVAAGHAKGDIPAALEREVRRDPATEYRFGRPLGPHPVLQEILVERVAEALRG